jgi:hypothetical protein
VLYISINNKQNHVFIKSEISRQISRVFTFVAFFFKDPHPLPEILRADVQNRSSVLKFYVVIMANIKIIVT